MDVYVMGLMVGGCGEAMETERGEITYGDFVMSEKGESLGLFSCQTLIVNFVNGTFKIYSYEGDLHGGRFDLSFLSSLIEGDE